jgi:hypothetical protein
MHPLIENNREAIARLCRVHPDARTRNSPPNLQAAGSKIGCGFLRLLTLCFCYHFINVGSGGRI